MFTSVRFVHKTGKSVLIDQVPVYTDDNTKNYEVSVYLNMLMDQIDSEPKPKSFYTFDEFFPTLKLLAASTDQEESEQIPPHRMDSIKKLWNKKNTAFRGEA